MLTNPKPLGYAYGEVLPSADVNSVWSQLPNALDGIGGGSYTLTAPLEIDGDVVVIDELEVLTTLLCTGDISVTGVLFAFGNVSLGNSGGDTLTVNAVATFQQNASFQGDVALGNSGSDTITLAGIQVATGAGRRRRRVSPGADADGSYGPKDWDRVRVSLNLAANRIYTIDDTNAADYDEIEFSLHSGPETLEIRDPAAVTITLLDTGGSYDWIRVIRLSGAWSLLERGKN